MIDLLTLRPLDPTTERSWVAAMQAADDVELARLRLETESDLAEYNVTLTNARREGRVMGRFLPPRVMGILEQNRAHLVRRLQGIQYNQTRRRQERRVVAKLEEPRRREARPFSLFFLEVAEDSLPVSTFEELKRLAEIRRDKHEAEAREDARGNV